MGYCLGLKSLALQLNMGLRVLIGYHGLAVGKGVVGVLGKPGLAVEHRAEGVAL